MNCVEHISSNQLGGSEDKVMLRTATLFPIDFFVGRISETLMLSHSSGKHISIVILIDYEITVLVMVEKTRRKFIELKAAPTLPIYRL